MKTVVPKGVSLVSVSFIALRSEQSPCIEAYEVFFSNTELTCGTWKPRSFRAYSM